MARTSNTEKKKKKVRKVLTEKEIQRKYAGSILASNISISPDDSLWIPSRNLYLNYTMGGGIRYGRICEIFGSESSGKSLVAKDFAYSTQYLGGIVLWNDSEQAFDPIWAVANGLDLSRIIVYNESSIEKISDWLADMAYTYRSKLINNEPILFVEDSIAALDCELNINSDQFNSKAEMGNRAKALYRMVRIRNQMLAEYGITSIFINQLRQKVGATQYEDPDTTPGGNAMKFFAHQRMAFFRKKQIVIGSKENKIWIGNEVSVRMKKNKLAPPRSSFQTEIYFNAEHSSVGFNKYTNLAELMEKTGVVSRRKGGSRYWYKGEVIANGRDNFQELLENDKDLRSRLLRKAGVNTLRRTESKINRLNNKGINRYKIKNIIKVEEDV